MPEEQLPLPAPRPHHKKAVGTVGQAQDNRVVVGIV